MATKAEELPNRIREIRLKRDMTLKQVAVAAKTTPQTIQRLETANMTVSMDWLYRLSAVLEVTPHELLKEQPVPDDTAAFMLAARDGMILNRRTVINPEDVFLAFSQANGTLAKQMLEYRAGLRPANDVYDAAAVVAGAAMRIALDAGERAA